MRRLALITGTLLILFGGNGSAPVYRTQPPVAADATNEGIKPGFQLGTPDGEATAGHYGGGTGGFGVLCSWHRRNNKGR